MILQKNTIQIVFSSYSKSEWCGKKKTILMSLYSWKQGLGGTTYRKWLLLYSSIRSQWNLIFRSFMYLQITNSIHPLVKNRRNIHKHFLSVIQNYLYSNRTYSSWYYRHSRKEITCFSHLSWRSFTSLMFNVEGFLP